MFPMIIENYTKNNVKQKHTPICKAFFFFFLSFSMLKIYFNYLIVYERSKNPWATCLNFVNLGDRIIFLLCK